MLELVLGGARSGKSRYAEQIAAQSAQTNTQVVYIATAQAHDDEMSERIKHHQQRRSKDWLTIESPLYLADAMLPYLQKNNIILVDCLTLWLSNLLCLPETEQFAEQRQALLQILPNTTAHVILVSNETGLGVVPMGELTRRFVDEAGFLHQQLAHMADRVTFMVAGLPSVLKDNG